MKIFQVLQRHYATLGISPSSNQSNQSNPFNERILFGCLLYGCVVISQFVYIFCVASGFMEYMLIICALSASIITIVSFAAIVFGKTKLFECIQKMEQLIDTRSKYPTSEAFFLETSGQVERLSEIIFMMSIKILLQFEVLPKFVISYGVYFITDSGSDSFLLPFPMWFPFDTCNPIGYLIAVILEYIIWTYQNLIVACTLSLAIGGYLFAISATKEFTRFAPIINDKAQANTLNQSNELKILLADFIYGHGLTKQMKQDFSDIFQPIAMSLFTWSLLAMSGALLIIQVEIVHHGIVMPMLLMVSSGLFALISVFIACELGHRLSDAFDEANLTLEQFDWYLFPIEIKRMLLVIMAIAQQPVEMECFGSITCTREVFKNIIHHTYSYFMVLRQFGN